ncbi:MAG TPA: hypothetical protein VIM13_11065 [Clostridia bacterium]
MSGLIFIVFLVIVIINIFKKASESGYNGSGEHKRFERYLEDNRQNRPEIRNIEQNERTRWYGSSYKSNAGKGDAQRQNGQRRSTQEANSWQTGQSTQETAAGQTRQSMADMAVKPNEPCDPNTAIMKNGAIGPKAADTNAADKTKAAYIPAATGSFLSRAEDMDKVFGDTSMDVPITADQSYTVTECYGVNDTESYSASDMQYEGYPQDSFEAGNSILTDYYRDIPVAAQPVFVKDAGSEGIIGTGALVWPEVNEKDYFMSDLKAFEFTDVVVDSQIKLDASMPLFEEINKAPVKTVDKNDGTAGKAE